MSTKHSSRKSTPVPSTPGSKASRSRDSPPLSPTRISRLQEKKQLQSLNDRLAQYIERVRHLESENSKLEYTLQTFTEVKTREVTSIRDLYDTEVCQLRKALDAEAKDRAKVDLENKRLTQQLQDATQKLNKVTSELATAEKELKSYQNRFNDVQTKYNQAQADLKKTVNENKTLSKENGKLQGELASKSKELDNETILRIDLENKMQSLKESMNFKDQMFEQLSESSRTIKTVELSDIDGQIEQKTEQKYYESLQSLRQEYEEDLKRNKDDLRKIYEDKLKTLEADLSRKNNLATNTYDQVRKLQADLDDARKQVKNLENRNNNLEEKLSKLEHQLQDERINNAQQLSDLQDSMNQQLQEYQDLMDIKIQLDREIAAYRQLLESEEARLKYTPTPGRKEEANGFSDDEDTPLRKRRRMFYDAEEYEDYKINTESKGDIVINEVCPNGTFVKIQNKGKEEINLGSWLLVRKVGDSDIAFKFAKTVKLGPNDVATVWSAGENKKHEPPFTVVMKNQKWEVGDVMVTVLQNKDGEDVSTVSHQKERRVRSRSFGKHAFGGFPQGGSGDGTCVMM